MKDGVTASYRQKMQWQRLSVTFIMIIIIKL